MSHEKFIVLALLFCLICTVIGHKLQSNRARAEVKGLRAENDKLAGEQIALIGFLEIERASVQSLKMEVDALEFRIKTGRTP
jgi:hypothetical protein